MKIAHINAGNEIGGGLAHIVSLLGSFKDKEVDLIVFEDGPVAEAARASGIRVYVFEQKNRFDLTVLNRLRAFIKRQDYALLHTHGPRANSLLAILTPLLNVKWIMTVHSHPLLDFKDNGLKGKAFEAIHKRTFKRADGIIAVSREIKVFLTSQGVAAERIKVIHNGIRFLGSMASPRPKEPDTFTLITVGRLTWVKGYDILMEALNELELKNWRWVVCGDGEEMTELKTKSEKYDVMHRIDFKGWLSAHELRQEMSQADLFVLPSLSETFPLVLLEAADEKIPAVATDVGDVSEVIKDPDAGWLIPPGSKDALKEALREAYDFWKTDRLKEKGERLNAFASEFSIEEQSRSVWAFYKEIMKKT
ncbi:MAG: glycosyltransferase family 4 protein [Alkalibacterium sp.]